MKRARENFVLSIARAMMCCLSLSAIPLSHQFAPAPLYHLPRRPSRCLPQPLPPPSLRSHIFLPPQISSSTLGTATMASGDVILPPRSATPPPQIGTWVSVALSSLSHAEGGLGPVAPSSTCGEVLAEEISDKAFGESLWVEELKAWAVESSGVHILAARASQLGWREGTFTSGEYVSLRLLEWSPRFMEALGRSGLRCAVEIMQGLALVREDELQEVSGTVCFLPSCLVCCLAHVVLSSRFLRFASCLVFPFLRSSIDPECRSGPSWSAVASAHREQSSASSSRWPSTILRPPRSISHSRQRMTKASGSPEV